MINFFKKYQIYIFILFFSILIIGIDFFTKSGTYFLLDVVFSPTTVWKGFFELSIYHHLFNFFNYLFGYIFFSKIHFFLVVFFTGVLAYKLSFIFAKILDIDDKYKNFFSFTFILFLYLNPVFYERMLTQVGIFLGMILIGFGVYFLLKNIVFKEKISNYIYSGILFGFSFSVMNHALYMIILIYLFYLIFFIRNKKIFFYTILSGIIFLLINLNWIIGNIFLGKGETLSYINILDQANVENFYTNGLAPLGSALTSLQLYGFWGERYYHFFLPETVNPSWYIVGFIILGIIIFGIYRYIKSKKERNIFYFLILIGFISYILALGINAPWGFISQFLYDYMPFYLGLREPHKWIGILMLVYSVFFSIGFYYLFLELEKILKNNYTKVIILFVLFIFLNSWTPNILFGFSGQVFMTDYPKDYFEFRSEELKKEYKNNKYLLLPWHSYIACDRTKGRIIANTLDIFLNPLHTIKSDNIEVGDLYTNSTNKRSQEIEEFIENQDITLLKKNEITHIMLFKKCADYKKIEEILEKLLKETKIKKLNNTENIDLYEIVK